PTSKRGCRIRCQQLHQAVNLELQPTEPKSREISVACEPSGFRISHSTNQATPGVVRMINLNSFSILVSFEDTEWSDEILTAARITNWQPFRDLFASEVISPTENVTVGAQVVLFTDLRGSTAMYHDLGDAAAYAVVRNHFAVL